MVMQPSQFKEMLQAIQALREHKSVLLNLTQMNSREAQRAVDFVTGGTYSLLGHQQRLGEKVFLFTPNGVKVSTKSSVLHEVSQPPKEDSPSRILLPKHSTYGPLATQTAMPDISLESLKIRRVEKPGANH